MSLLGQTAHEHDFKMVARTYAPPVPNAVRSADANLIKMVAMGVTTFLYMCKCGDGRVTTLLGREERGVVDIKFTEVKR